MVSGFNIIGQSEPLQSHWIKRFIALIVDAVIFFVISVVLSILVWPFGGGLGFFGLPLLISGLLWFLYAWLMDMAAGGTLGKKVMGLRVVTMDGQNINAVQALVRNVTKFYWLFLLLDWIIGLAMDGDPRQKFTDRVVGSTVARTDQMAYQEEQFRQMGRGMTYTPPAYSGPVSQGPPGYAQPMQPMAPAQAQPQQPMQPQAVAQTPTPAQQPGWPPPQQPTGQWPQHQWGPQGQLQPQARFCTNCGGQLVPRGDGRVTCVRCGAVY